MDHDAVLKTILEDGVIVIIRTGRPDKAVRLAQAVHAGGCRAIEITLNVPGSLEAIRTLSGSLEGKAVIGAGTVTNKTQARQSVEAGARYVVSPVFDLDTVRWCRKNGVVCCPGCLTPTEIVTAWDSGADLIKIFPASSLGPGYVRELKAPLPHLRLMPTGGVTADNVAEYFRAGASAVGVGSGIIDRKAAEEERWSDITALAARFMEAVHKARN